MPSVSAEGDGGVRVGAGQGNQTGGGESVALEGPIRLLLILGKWWMLYFWGLWRFEVGVGSHQAQGEANLAQGF